MIHGWRGIKFLFILVVTADGTNRNSCAKHQPSLVKYWGLPTEYRNGFGEERGHIFRGLGDGDTNRYSYYD